MQVYDLLPPFFTGDKIIDHIHGSGPVERIHCDEILHPVRPELTKIILHSGAFKLENTDGIAVSEQIKGFRIIERDIFN